MRIDIDSFSLCLFNSKETIFCVFVRFPFVVPIIYQILTFITTQDNNKISKFYTFYQYYFLI